MFSCVLILPIAYTDSGNSMAEILGYGPNNFSVLLSTTGTEPASHAGLHSWITQSFIDLLDNPTIPEILLNEGFTQEKYTDLQENLIKSYWVDYVDHFNTIIEKNNLITITDDISINDIMI
jgi:hypothetical protein